MTREGRLYFSHFEESFEQADERIIQIRFVCASLSLWTDGLALGSLKSGRVETGQWP